MKKIVVVCLLLVVNVALAQDNTAFKNEAIEFIKLTGAGSAFDAAIAQFGSTVSDDKKQAYTTEASSTLDGLYTKMADLYMAEFTQDEIKQLLAFYKSPLGKKLAEKQLALTQQGMMLGQNWAVEVQGIAKKYQ
ncbi:DUF2059 domain-containing protein [Tamlana sp. I1]|uniref:DUF2059 domain-containing protein n=1 Tax=Tamlana sp. I1 TaxID=2762061 RepID=UPI00188F0A8E|nr:DUF2059 domain-containing protein [Tamlana sp. I1]